jgi:hypothetical protein
MKWNRAWWKRRTKSDYAELVLAIFLLIVGILLIRIAS